MCVAIYKPEGSKFLTESLYEQCWDLNDDGGSISYYDNNIRQWIVYKGMMLWADWVNKYDEMRKSGELTIDQRVFIHFRVGTAGPKSAQALTHPFPVTNDYEEMSQVHFNNEFIVAHNGTIGKGQPDKSDTMMGVHDYIDPMRELVFTPTGRRRNEKLEYIMRECLDTATSRWFFGMKDHVYLYGPWKNAMETHETWFSNNDYTEAARLKLEGSYTYSMYGAGMYGSGIYAGSDVEQIPLGTARHKRQGFSINQFLNDKGIWDFSKWESFNYDNKVDSEPIQEVPFTTQTCSDDAPTETNNECAVVAFLKADGRLEWDKINYTVDSNYMICSICQSDEVYKFDTVRYNYRYLCANCGCIFSGLDGEVHEWDDNVNDYTEAMCMYCNEIVMMNEHAICTACGARLDPTAAVEDLDNHIKLKEAE
jgi:predicted glutamine amidotransferase